MNRPEHLILGAMPKGAEPDKYLAAGPWCFCGLEKDFPQWETSFTFAAEPLADGVLAPVAAKAAQALAVKMIPAIAGLLAAEPEKLPAAYWQVLLAPWTMDVASQIVDRCLRAKAMREQWGELELEVSLLPECGFAFADEHDFTLRGSLGIQFNHWLFTRILLDDWPGKWRKTILPKTIPEKDTLPEQSLKARFREKVRRLALKLPFPKMKGMTFGQALKFSLALARPCSGADHSLDQACVFSFEKELSQIPLPTDILGIFKAALPQSLRNLRHTEIPSKTKYPRLRVASIIAHEDAQYRQKLALWRAGGNRLAYCQHGGNYGQVKTPCAAEVVEYSQDVFFTWGWKTQGTAKGNFMPLPSPQLCREANAWHGKNGGPLIFVGTEMAAYGHRLDSHPTPLQFVTYRRAKAVFFAKLAPEIRSAALYRPYFPLPGTLADAEWLLPQFPEVKLCQGDLLKQILDCRLLVIDHHGTTLLEAIAAGTPMLLYWDRRMWPLAAECDVLLDMLEAAGIWHATPESAAAKAGEIWSDPSAWWQSPEVRMAAHIFRERQALVKKDAESIWLKTLKKL